MEKLSKEKEEIVGYFEIILQAVPALQVLQQQSPHFLQKPIWDGLPAL